MQASKLSAGLAALTFAATTLAQSGCPSSQTCFSYGIDFVSGGSYFQNSLSTDPFTAVQEFEGCQNDTSHNVLVDPNGDQYECSLTPLTPDDTPETVTCPVDKNQLYTGEWSLLIISNNGACQPIAYERDFYLSVGPQQTITVTPTITISTTTTPIVSQTSTKTTSITSTAHAVTTTVPLINLDPTLTIFPLPSVTVVTRAILTVTSTSQIPSVVATSTSTQTASCVLPERRQVQDPVAKIVATILSDLGLATGVKAREAAPQPTGRSASTEFKRAVIEGRAVEPQVKAQYLAERREELALNKRAPDEPTITVTDTSAVPVTSTLTSTAPTSTVVGTTTLVSTITTTPTVTVSKGIAFSIATVTAAAQTLTNTFLLPATTVFATHTTDVTLTITSTATPAGLAASCSSAGGTLS